MCPDCMFECVGEGDRQALSNALIPTRMVTSSEVHNEGCHIRLHPID